MLGGGDSALTSAPPGAFGFLGGASAAVSFSGDATHPEGLAVPRGQCLNLIGAGVQVDQARLAAPSGRVNLISAASPGEVVFNPADPNAVPNVSSFAMLGSVRISSGSAIAVTEGGRLLARARDMTVTDSSIVADNFAIAGGGIDISASGPLTLTNSHLSADSRGSFTGGIIQLSADSISLSGLPADHSEPVSVEAFGAGAGGSILVKTGSLAIVHNGALTAFTDQSGTGGSITVNASRSITIDGTDSTDVTGMAAETFALFGGGRGGNITVSTPLLAMRNMAEITSTTKGSGDAGSITVNTDELNIDGGNLPKSTLIQARVGKGVEDSGATGHGGQIIVNAGSIDLRRGGVITATNFGRGTGGDIVVRSGKIVAVGSPNAPFTGVFARTSPGRALDGGGGPGGSVRLVARDVRLQGNAAVSAVSTSGGGRAGSVAIDVQSLTLRGGAKVTVQADGGVAGGEITVKAGHDINLIDSRMSAEAAGDGRIFLTAARSASRPIQHNHRSRHRGGWRTDHDRPAVGRLRSVCDQRTLRWRSGPGQDRPGRQLFELKKPDPFSCHCHPTRVRHRRQFDRYPSGNLERRSPPGASVRSEVLK